MSITAGRPVPVNVDPDPTAVDVEVSDAALRIVLKDYAPLFTYWDHGVKHEGPITAVISGNRARQAIADDPIRYCAYDGLLVIHQ